MQTTQTKYRLECVDFLWNTTERMQYALNIPVLRMYMDYCKKKGLDANVEAAKHKLMGNRGHRQNEPAQQQQQQQEEEEQEQEQEYAHQEQEVNVVASSANSRPTATRERSNVHATPIADLLV